jgi:hypothetical protein
LNIIEISLNTPQILSTAVRIVRAMSSVTEWSHSTRLRAKKLVDGPVRENCEFVGCWEEDWFTVLPIYMK